jgi:phage protein D
MLERLCVESPLFPENSSTPAVRRPVLELSFGSGSADDWGRSVVSVAVQAGLAPSADTVEVYLDGSDQAPAVAVGDTGSVSLGYEDGSTELTFSGQVEGVRYSVDGATFVTAVDGGAALSALRINQSYEQQKAGDIVRDLAGRAGVATDTVEDGVEFPFYVVDDRRSAYLHIAALARKSGYLAWFTPEGKLSFAPFVAGQPVQTFTYGVDIISLEVTDAAPVVGAVTTVGEGAAGSQGQEAWSWLVKDPSSVKGSAGEGAPEREVQDSSLRSSDAAQSAADGVASAAGRTGLTGKLLVPGSPAAVVGSAIEIVDSPQEALNGLFLMRRVRHRFSKAEGFTTLICFTKTGDGGLGGLL